MRVFVTTKSDYPRDYDHVEILDIENIGGQKFLHLCNKDKTKISYISLDDILRVTIEKEKYER